jgi:hypothetical protein
MVCASNADELPDDWMALPYFVERAAAGDGFLPGCILAAIGFADGFPALVDWFKRRQNRADEPGLDFTRRPWINLTLLVLTFAFFVGSALIDLPLHPNQKPRTPNPRVGLLNTPPDNRFLILTGDGGRPIPSRNGFPPWPQAQPGHLGPGMDAGPVFFWLTDLVDLQNAEAATIQACRERPA